jgi:hypothetical protein
MRIFTGTVSFLINISVYRDIKSSHIKPQCERVTNAEQNAVDREVSDRWR